MTYDHWKTTNPEDERYMLPPCEETPEYDDYDFCMWCGANPTQGCQWGQP